MAPDMCPACLDLEYERFQGVCETIHEVIDETDLLYPFPRYRIVLREEVEAAADDGCDLCRVLRDGMLYFWGDKGPYDGEEDENGEEESKEESDEEHVGESGGEDGEDAGGDGDGDDGGNDGPNPGDDHGNQDHNGMVDSKPTGIDNNHNPKADSVRSVSTEDGNRTPSVTEHDDDETQNRRGKICIELRPGRSLGVTWAGPVSQTYSVFDIRPRLDFFVDAGGDDRPAISDAFGRALQTKGDIDLDSAATTLKRWLDGCSSHPACCAQSDKLPRRLLDLSKPKAPRLVETSTMGTSDMPHYTTLSHCWGTSESHQPLCTTQDTYSSMTAGIHWSDVPHLFRHAILLTRALGCRYIWIDSLCIIQGDEKDWIEHSASMADIYSYGYLNIAAAAATNSSGSLFQERQEFVRIVESVEYGPVDTHTIEPTVATLAPVHVRRSHQHTHSCVLGVDNQSMNAVNPLLERAWVFQEQLLSRRAVFFTSSELLWQCQECVRCECGDMDSHSATVPQIEQALVDPNRLPGQDLLLGLVDYGTTKRRFINIASGRSSVQQARRFWEAAIQQYSSMALTRESDRPYAIAGIGRRVHERTGDTYFAGLWLEDLPRGLLWDGQIQSSKTAWRRPGIPSWSWVSRAELAGTGSPLTSYSWINLFGFRTDPRLRVLAEGTFSLTNAGDTFGSVLEGQLRLEAAVRQGVVIGPGETLDDKFMVKVNGRDEEAFLDCPFDEKEPVCSGDVVCCVMVGSEKREDGELGHSLLLRAVGGRQGLYRRVGVIMGHRLLLFAEAPVDIFTII